MNAGHRWKPSASDDGFKRVVVQQSFFRLIKRVFEMEEERPPSRHAPSRRAPKF
jgi:hypothetical protein